PRRTKPAGGMIVRWSQARRFASESSAAQSARRELSRSSASAIGRQPSLRPRPRRTRKGGGGDSNPRPPGPQPGALPTELPPPRSTDKNSRGLKILASRRFPGPAWDELDDVEYLSAALPGGAGGRREDVEALAVVGERVSDETLDLLPNLRVVANYGVGYDSVDVRALAARGVLLTNTPGVLTAATADLTFAVLLAVRRRIVAGDRAVR